MDKRPEAFNDQPALGGRPIEDAVATTKAKLDRTSAQSVSSLTAHDQCYATRFELLQIPLAVLEGRQRLYDFWKWDPSSDTLELQQQGAMLLLLLHLEILGGKCTESWLRPPLTPIKL